jgi:hypothetical protein
LPASITKESAALVPVKSSSPAPPTLLAARPAQSVALPPARR